MTLNRPKLIVHHAGGGLMVLTSDYKFKKGEFFITQDDGIPTDPEHEQLCIGVYDTSSSSCESFIYPVGRKGLNDWYESVVGYRPDDDNGTPLPILELLHNVAEMFYRHTTNDAE